MRFFQHPFKPGSGALAVPTFSMHPQVCMGMDDIAFGDVEYLVGWHVQECELRQVEVQFEKLIFYSAGVLPADEHGPAF